jgi:hypothetical protein
MEKAGGCPLFPEKGIGIAISVQSSIWNNLILAGF